MTLWNGVRVPMTLLGGYLGAGKTTIVNHVLGAAGDEGRRIAVLVNDLGTVQVDAALIRARHDDTIELANGCICCSLVDGLAVALETLRQRPEPPDHVLVELSGVAEPGRVVPWASTAGFRLDGVVVVADADQIRDRASDPRLAGLVDAQLGAADLVLVTKTDLLGVNVDPEDGATDGLWRWLTDRTSAPAVVVVDGQVDVDVVLGPLVAAGRTTSGGLVRGSADSLHVDAAVQVGRVGRGQLVEAIAAVADLAGVVRVKGTVATDEGSVLVQVVGARATVTPWSGALISRLVVIALDDESLASAVDRLSGLTN